MPSDRERPEDREVQAALGRRVKAELRKRMRGLRNTLPESACAERSARIVGRLLAVEPMLEARSVALFWPMEARHEVDLRPLDATLRDRGVRVAYPAIDAVTREMSLRFVAEPQAMVDRGLGFCEPAGDAPEAAPGELDVVIVPALAADPSGQRIGYGAGYYDRTLPRFAPQAASVAVVFDFQLLAEIPTWPGDVAVGWVVTDTRTLQVARAAGLP